MNYHYRVTEDSMERFSPQNQVGDAKRWGLAILLFHVLHSQAQDTPVASPERLQKVTVTGNALGNAEGIQAVQVLQGEELLMHSQSTLGETLATPQACPAVISALTPADPSSAAWMATESKS